MELEARTIGVIGLGYVGLPLAVALAERYATLGFDIDANRIAELRAGIDRSREVSSEALKRVAGTLALTTAPDALARCDLYIVTVPTPIDAHRQPDLGPLRRATRTLGQVLKPGDLVIYESTVYPGATEEICAPLLEEISGLTFNRDFFLGYSPERINPGDRAHRLSTIKKVTAGSTPETAELVDQLYRSIIPAGTHRASSIRVAEAAKVIENTQRDVNIALINELAILFERLGLDTQEVLEAAGSKWNFLHFRPGLVGGHCIGVDPYYLTYKAQALGYHPEIILAGRRLNDRMAAYVAHRVIKLLMQRQRTLPPNPKALILGLTFKENCPDLRNTQVIPLIQELRDFGMEVAVYDPWADPQEALETYGLSLLPSLEPDRYEAIILAVAHREFAALDPKVIRALGHPETILFDVKSLLPAHAVDGRL